MKPIEKGELFTHINDFLKKRGIEMKEGSYSQAIQNSCSFLTDAINLSQKGMERAKTEFDRQMDHMREVIHERTAPKTATSPKSKGQASRPKGKASSNKARSGKGDNRKK